MGDHELLNMKKNNSSLGAGVFATVGGLAIAAYILLSCAIPIAILYIVIHFVLKFW